MSLTMSSNSLVHDQVLFSERFGILPYSINVHPEDRTLMEEWKRQVDDISAYIHQRIEGNFAVPEEPPIINGKSHILTDRRIIRAFGDTTYDHDVTLFSIGAFVLAHYPKFSKWQAGLKILIGGEFDLSDYGKGVTTCMDAATAAGYLADLYEIPGTVKRYDKTYHHYWQETGDSGRILDTTWCNDHNGLVVYPKQHRKIIAHNAKIRAQKR